MQAFSIEEPLVEGARRGTQRSTVTTFFFAVLCVFGVACLLGNALAPVGFALTPAVPGTRPSTATAPMAPNSFSPAGPAWARAPGPLLEQLVEPAPEDVLAPAAVLDQQSAYEAMATGSGAWMVGPAYAEASAAAGPSGPVTARQPDVLVRPYPDVQQPPAAFTQPGAEAVNSAGPSTYGVPSAVGPRYAQAPGQDLVGVAKPNDVLDGPWQYYSAGGAKARSRTPAPTMSIAERAIAGATQGAVGAVVAALLSAFTEPVVNRILVERISLMESVKQLDVKKSLKFMQTTLPTNFLKFPLFEAVNAVLEVMPISGALKGAVTGLVFTTVTLPVTNYRFCKSMGYTIDGEALFKAYLPTVARDIAYGIARNFLRVALFTAYAGQAATAGGRSLLLFPIVFGACVLSSPGNELRGYYLQPKDKRLGFKEFFKPVNYLRSTITGACIMGIALMSGGYLTPMLERLFKGA